jgi:hypothetical protein
MLLLAVDPGPEKSAWVVYETNPGERAIVDFGIDENGIMRQRLRPRALPARLGPGARDQCAFSGVSRHYFPEVLAIEMIASYGMPVGADVFETCVWIGRLIERWGGPYQKIPRLQVKMALCHNARANDANIRAALIDHFGKPGTKKAPGATYGVTKDVWAALGVAVTCAALGAAGPVQAAPRANLALV